MENATVTKTFSPMRYKKVDFVLSKMENNPNFPDPVPDLAIVRQRADNYFASLLISKKGSVADTVIKKDNRKKLENSMRELAEYVQLISKGDELKIISSGFDINQKPALVGPLGKADNLIVRPGLNRGCVMLKCNVVPHTKLYVFEYCLTPETADSIWSRVMSSKSKVHIEGLESGKEYSFRVAAAGTNPSLIWSNVISSYVI